MSTDRIEGSLLRDAEEKLRQARQEDATSEKNAHVRRALQRLVALRAGFRIGF